MRKKEEEWSAGHLMFHAEADMSGKSIWVIGWVFLLRFRKIDGYFSRNQLMHRLVRDRVGSGVMYCLG